MLSDSKKHTLKIHIPLPTNKLLNRLWTHQKHRLPLISIGQSYSN